MNGNCRPIAEALFRLSRVVDSFIGRNLVVIDALDSLFEFDDTATQGSHHAGKAIAKQKEHDDADNDQLDGTGIPTE
jgi:hypothetical protein